MNTKKRNIGARLGAMLLSLCLMMGLLPTTAFAQDTGTTIFGYEGSGTWSMASVSAEDQSDYTALTSYDSFDWFYGLEMIGDTIYGVYSSYYNSSYDSELVILNPDLTIQERVGRWFNSSLEIEQIIDTTVQNGTLWGTYNTAEYDYSLEGDELVSTFRSGTSYLIPIDLTTGQPDTSRKVEVTGLPDREIIYTIACNASGQMYAIVADGGENGGAATLYTIDTTNFAATKVGDTGVTTNYVSSSTFALDGTLYWAENNAGKLYTVNTDNGTATAVLGGTIGGKGNLTLNAMMIPSDTATTAYVNFVVNGEGTVTMNGQEVSGWQKVTPGADLALIFTPAAGRNVKEVVVDGEKMEFIDSYTLKNVSAWSAGTHTVEVTFGSRDIEITANPWVTEYLGEHSLQYHPSFEATLYFTVSNGPSRNTAGVSNYQISIEKDGQTIDKSDVVPGTYDIHVTRAEDKYWNELDTILEDCLIITKQTSLIQWSDLELTANPGDTLADIEKPAYLVSPLDGKQIPGTFYWVDDEGTSVGELGDRTGFKFRFVPDMPLPVELAALYDFSNMPENGFDGTESNYPFTAYVTVKEASEIPGCTDQVDLPVRVLEEEDTDYSPAPELSATFTPNSAVTVGEFNEWQGLAIDYYYPMIGAQLSEGYDIQAEYTVSIPLTDYDGTTLSGTLTVPLPDGYDGASARIKGGAAAGSYTATTVSFPVTLDVSYGTAEASLLIEYKEAQEPVQPPVIIAGANGSWQKGGKDGLSFTSNAAFADFIKVQVDGKDLDASNYTVKEGSTIVTLNAAYLSTLSVGKHTLSIVSANGTATTEFTITAAQTGGDQTGSNQTGGDSQTGGDNTTTQDPDKNEGAVTSPQTGDNSNMLLWVALLFASGVGLFGAVVYSRKKRYNP